MPTASKKVINAWAMYDWANSSYSLTIASAIFPTYYTSLAPERVEMLGRVFDRTALASYTISLSFLIIAFLSPILSSIADYQGNKKSFMKKQGDDTVALYRETLASIREAIGPQRYLLGCWGMPIEGS